MQTFSTVAVLCSALSVFGQPAVDYHQHFFHPADTGLAPDTGTVTAKELIALLDEAKIQRALVLSTAYQFANPNRPPVSDEYAKVRAENDWTAQQVALFPKRLIGFCGFNPLRDYALEELERCASNARLGRGIKMHFGNSDVDLANAEHIRKLQQVFRLANQRRMALVIHMRSSVTRNRPYGSAQARAFLTELLPLAPKIDVQIAHFAGAGGYDDPLVDEALQVFVDAIAKKDRRMARVYFDISGIVGLGEWKARAELIVKRARELGVERVLYGSDGSAFGNSPKVYWGRFRELPFSEAEFRKIEGNIAPYLR